MVVDVHVRYDFAMLADVLELYVWGDGEYALDGTTLWLRRWWAEPSEPF